MTILAICHESKPVPIEELEVMGVESVRDIPDDFPLNERQRRAATCVQKGKPWFSANSGRSWVG